MNNSIFNKLDRIAKKIDNKAKHMSWSIPFRMRQCLAMQFYQNIKDKTKNPFYCPKCNGPVVVAVSGNEIKEAVCQNCFYGL